MPIFLLDDALRFPDPRLADPEGIIAVGGDLRPARLLRAYRSGIFPWPVANLPLLWFSPDPRALVPKGAVHVARSLRKSIRKAGFELRADTAFEAVIRACASTPRPNETGTWIGPDVMRGYCELHEQGYAHSVEVWQGSELVGGLYGVSLGAMFSGESMFHRATDASKTAFVATAIQLDRWGFQFLDCQVPTEHLTRLGAVEMRRREFLRKLKQALRHPDRMGPWKLDDDLLDALT